MSQLEKYSIFALAVSLIQLGAFGWYLQTNVHYIAMYKSVPFIAILALAPLIFRIQPAGNKQEFRKDAVKANILNFALMGLMILLMIIASQVLHSYLLFFALFVAFMFIFYKLRSKKESGGKVFFGMDERDRLIALKASRITFTAFWIAFVYFATMITRDHSLTDQIPVYWVKYALFGGAWLMIFVQSATSLIFCRSGIVAGYSEQIRQS